MGKQYIVAVDLGGTNIKLGLFGGGSRILKRRLISTRSYKGRNELINGLAQAVPELLKQKRIKKSQVLGLGIGLPGPTDANRGIVHFLPNISGWKEVPLKKILETKLHLPVFVDNDAKIMTLAEHKYGAARKYKNALCVTLGTGVGGGLILDGRLYRGQDNASGEIGHLPINETGPLCNCGGLACLESYVGNLRIIAEAKKAFGKEVSLEELSLLAGRGNRKAREIWETVGRRLGLAFTALVNTLNLDAIVVGGGVAAAGKALFEPIIKTIKKRAMSVQAKRVKLFKARFASDAGLVGAMVLVRQRVSS